MLDAGDVTRNVAADHVRRFILEPSHAMIEGTSPNQPQENPPITTSVARTTLPHLRPNLQAAPITRTGSTLLQSSTTSAPAVQPNTRSPSDAERNTLEDARRTNETSTGDRGPLVNPVLISNETVSAQPVAAPPRGWVPRSAPPVFTNYCN